MRWEKVILAGVSVSHRAQQIIAITLVIVLLAVTGISLKHENSPKDTMGREAGISNSNKEEKSAQKNDINQTKSQTIEVAQKLATTIEVDKNENGETAEVTDNVANVEVSKKTDISKSDELKAIEDIKVTTAATKNFVYTAEPGDSYTALARSAVQKYGENNKLNLSKDQVEQTSAVLAYKAGSPFLEIGQVVTIVQTDISEILGRNVVQAAPNLKSTEATQQVKQVSTIESFKYEAVAGDSYTLLARKAVNTYIKDANMKLTGAQRIAAETFIASNSGFPELIVGQSVNFTKDSIKDAVETVTNLPVSKLALWQPYADLAGL